MDDKYKNYLNSREWKEKREQRLKIDGARCVCCGSKERLNVHHLTYDRIYTEDMKDLITLCSDCHQSIHESYSQSKKSWLRFHPDGKMDIINADLLFEVLRDSFGAKGRVLSYLLAHRSEWNIVFGTMKEISAMSEASVQSCTDIIKCLRKQNIIKTRSGLLMFNPKFIKARGDKGNGELEKKYETFDKRATGKND